MRDEDFDVERWVASSRPPSHDGMTFREISEQLGMPEHTVKQIVNRGLVKAERIIRARFPEFTDVHTYGHSDLPPSERE